MTLTTSDQNLSAAAAVPSSSADTVFGYLCDTHVCAPKKRWSEFIEIPNFDASLRTDLILQEMASEQRLDFMIHGGDVVDCGAVREYTVYDNLLRSTLPNIQCYVVVGNHDEASAIKNELGMGDLSNLIKDGDKLSYTFRRGPHHFIIIDGRVKDFNRAEVGATGREWLRERLNEIPVGEFAWPVLHFPVRRHSNKLHPRVALEDGNEVDAIFLDFPDKVRLALHCHLHLEAMYSSPGSPTLSYYSAPCASYPLRIGNGNGPEFDPQGAIGYQRIHLAADGTFRIENRPVDVSASIIK